jgi:hypothetical protein
LSTHAAAPRYLLHTALLYTLAGVFVGCGETVTLESGRSYHLPSDVGYWGWWMATVPLAAVSGLLAIVALAQEDKADTYLFGGMSAAFAILGGLCYPGLISPSDKALETAMAKDAARMAEHAARMAEEDARMAEEDARLLDDPEYQRKVANEALERVVEKRDARLRPEMARQQQLFTEKRAEIETLMTKTNVASHEDLLRRAEESVELLHLKNLVDEAAIAQRAAEWLAVKINQHDILAEHLRSQVARLDSIIALQGVATAEELKEVRSVVNGAMAAVEENLTVPEREDHALLAAKLFDELQNSPTPHESQLERAPKPRPTALDGAGR